MRTFNKASIISLTAFLFAAYWLYNATGYHPYNWYNTMRLLVFFSLAVAAYVEGIGQFKIVAFIAGAIALLFNPFAPIHLDRHTWHNIDLGAVVICLVCAIFVVLPRKPIA